MIRLASIIQTFEKSFLAQYANKLLPSQRNALEAIKSCRSDHSPKMLVGCTACDEQHYVPHSCGHRSCPHCQNHESQQWIERQLKKQVPADYFLVTFTLPAEFRPLAWQHQRDLYSMMIQSSWDTLKSFSENDEQLQGTPGAIAVLHTHSRRLDYHPHVHLVMPAAAINRMERLWRKKTPKKGSENKPYLFNHKALALVFRAKMLDAITKKGLLLPEKHPKKWVVDCKSVGSGEKALVYLGRYLYRGVVQEKDIVACKNGEVTFRYENSKSKKTEIRKLSGEQFLWLVLQHVLPKGFRRTRNFGFLHPNSKSLIKVVQLLFKLDPNRLLPWLKERPTLTCRCCGAPMRIIKTRIAPTLIYTAPLTT